MSHCDINHSEEDVTKKLQSQQPYLPSDLYISLKYFLNNKQEQDILNDCFHLLKKYDLASIGERKSRDQKLFDLIGEDSRDSTK